MTWPQVIGTILAGFAIAGVLSIILVVCNWNKVGRVVNDLLAKLLKGVVKLIAGVASIGGAYAAAQKEEWWLPAILGMICLVLWEGLEKLIDNRVKATDKVDKDALTRAEQESESRTELLTVFRNAVSEKIKRLMRAMTKRKEKPSTTLVRSVLTPDDHLGKLLERLAAFFSEQLPKTAPSTTNFRVGLYVDRTGTMAPLSSVNLNNPSYDVFTSYREHQQSFRLDCADRPSHAVKCVNTRQSIIIEDCEAAAAVGEFDFFTENQRSYLRSLLAYYLGEVICDDGTTTMAALVIDTDLAGYFRKSERESLEFCLREFAARIKLELLLQALLTARGVKP